MCILVRQDCASLGLEDRAAAVEVHAQGWEGPSNPLGWLFTPNKSQMKVEEVQDILHLDYSIVVYVDHFCSIYTFVIYADFCC